MNKNKLWGIGMVVFCLLLLIVLGGMTAVIDPFFHYHAPLEQLQYPLNNQRYQNDGIIQHFEYDAIITGTSMTENLRTSEMDALFGTNAIKTSFSGGTFTELNRNLNKALQANPDIKMVLYGMDGWFLFEGKGQMRTDAVFPDYLYDDNLFNDVEYVLNKEIFFSDTLEVPIYTRQGNITTSFDDYSSWRWFTFSREETLKNYPRPERTGTIEPLTDELIGLITDNMHETVAMAKEYPDVTFVYFFPPYSALYWDELERTGRLEYQMEAFRLATELLLQADNIQLYSFLDDYEIVLDLDNDLDSCHHTVAVNSRVLEKIHAGEHRLTKDKYESY